MRKRKKPELTEVVQVRLTKAERRAFDKLLLARGETASGFLRELIKVELLASEERAHRHAVTPPADIDDLF